MTAFVDLFRRCLERVALVFARFYTQVCKQELVILGWMKTDALEGVRVCEEDVYLVLARKPWRRRARYLASLSTPVCSATSPGPPTLPTLPMQCYNMLQRQVRFDLFKISS